MTEREPRYYMSIPDAARIERIPATAIWRWIREGRMSQPVGKSRRVVSLHEVHELAELMGVKRD